MIGKFLNWIGYPGMVSAIKETTPNGDTIEIRNSSLYTIITANGRDYFFFRMSGKFDGTGQDVPCSSTCSCKSSVENYTGGKITI